MPHLGTVVLTRRNDRWKYKKAHTQRIGIWNKKSCVWPEHRLHLFCHGKLMKLTGPDLLVSLRMVCLPLMMLCMSTPQLNWPLIWQESDTRDKSSWASQRRAPALYGPIPPGLNDGTTITLTGPAAGAGPSFGLPSSATVKAGPGKRQLLSWARQRWGAISRWPCSWHWTQIIVVYQDAFSCHLAFHCWTKRLKDQLLGLVLFLYIV